MSPRQEMSANRRHALEKHAIAAVLADPSLYPEVHMLRCVDFSDPQHQAIWDRIQSVATSGKIPTPVNVAAASFDLEESELTALARTADPNVDTLRQVAAEFINNIRRAASRDIIRMSLSRIDDAATDWQAEVARLVHSLSDTAMTRAAISGDEARRALTVSSAMRATKGRVRTGLSAIDNFLSGGMPPALIAMGAFGKRGKTTMVATISYNMELDEVPHLVVTIERDATHIEALKAAREMKINAIELSNHLCLPPSLLPRRSVHYIHGTKMTVDQVRNDILFLVRTKGIRAALIDYWQLIEPGPMPPGSRRSQAMEKIIMELQRTVTDAQIPIFLTYQLGDGPQNSDIQAARTAANLCIQLQREDSECWMQTVATNISAEHDIGGVTAPVIIFDRDVGPHFRDP